MNIVVLDGFTTNPGDLDWTSLEKLGNLTVYERTDASDIVEKSKSADVVVVNKIALVASSLNQLPKLKCICTLATGYNNVDAVTARSRGVTVCNAVGYSTPSVAQHVFSFILNFTNRISHYDDEVQVGRWTHAKDWTYISHSLVELADKKMGIYGYGKIGQQTGQIARAFGMKVLVLSRSPKKDIHADVTYVSENDFFTQSDFISLHAPLSDDNKEYVDKGKLSMMKPSAFLINTGRGGLINENDLRDALENEVIAGAGLDVLSQEPPRESHPLLGVKNCVLTPHLAWATKESRKRLIDIVAQNIEAFINGNPQNVVN